MNELISVANCFLHCGDVKEITPFGEGHINSTYRVCLKNTKNEYVLQKINHSIFRDVDLLQNNIKRITDHIHQKIAESGEKNLERRTLSIIPTLDGKLFYADGENYWRMTLLIPDSITFEAITPRYAFCAGRAFGNFQAMLADLPGEPLGETIPNFHNMEYRLASFREAVKKDAVGRLTEVTYFINEIERRAEEMCVCEQLYREGKLPKRINHCDTKVNNILFDGTGNVLCIIDLDTTMPGFVMSDFGDFMRSAANTGKEDDIDLRNVAFNMEIFKSYTQGYLQEARSFLSPIESELLPYGAKLITYMQVIRFLGDYLNGDTYYKIANPIHNWQRTQAQFKLLQSIEEHYEEMKVYINSLM